MKAMILAAGVGSRLRPLTDKTPKALIEVGGKSMLETIALRLKAAGASALIVNAHHHAEQVVSACARLEKALGLPVAVSREDELLLETGGGVKKAAGFFDDGKPFLVHNGDILTDLDLKALFAAHLKGGAQATLAVMDRPTKRKLSFDEKGRLLGRAEEGKPGTALGFSGVYAANPSLFGLMMETGKFSLTDFLVRVAPIERIGSYRCDGAYWTDIGDAMKLEAARRRAEGRTAA